MLFPFTFSSSKCSWPRSAEFDESYETQQNLLRSGVFFGWHLVTCLRFWHRSNLDIIPSEPALQYRRWNTEQVLEVGTNMGILIDPHEDEGFWRASTIQTSRGPLPLDEERIHSIFQQCHPSSATCVACWAACSTSNRGGDKKLFLLCDFANATLHTTVSWYATLRGLLYISTVDVAEQQPLFYLAIGFFWYVWPQLRSPR